MKKTSSSVLGSNVKQNTYSLFQEEYEKVISDLVRARTAFETVESKVFRNSMLSVVH